MVLHLPVAGIIITGLDSGMASAVGGLRIMLWLTGRGMYINEELRAVGSNILPGEGHHPIIPPPDYPKTWTGSNKCGIEARRGHRIFKGDSNFRLRDPADFAPRPEDFTVPRPECRG